MGGGASTVDHAIPPISLIQLFYTLTKIYTILFNHIHWDSQNNTSNSSLGLPVAKLDLIINFTTETIPDMIRSMELFLTNMPSFQETDELP